MSNPMVPCYQSTTRQYRHEMAGSPEATNLPKPTDGNGIEKWGTAKSEFQKMLTDMEDGLRAAEAAHEGRAADAANATINEIKPHMERTADASGTIQHRLEEQVSYQHEAFKGLPSEGEKLPNGRDVQLDPPEKGWVEKAGLDNNPITGWMSDYEERQEDFRSTNERAVTAMERYRAQTDGNLGQLPSFTEDKQARPPGQPSPGSGMTDAGAPLAGSGYSGGSGMGGGSAVGAGTSSESAVTPNAPGSSGPMTPGDGGSVTPPADSGSAWADGPVGPGGPGGPNGPNGPGAAPYQHTPGAGGQQGAGGAVAGGGVAGGASASGGAANQLGAGGRTGVGGASGSTAGSGTAASTSSSGSGARGAPIGAGAGARGQGMDEDEHERPSWLLESGDVFTNDMQRVAPPVLGEIPER